MDRETNYTKRELDAHFERLLEHMTSFEAETGASLMRIERQTTATNGRVTKLEDAAIKKDLETARFRTRIYTAVGMLTFIIGTIIVPLVAAYIGKV